MKTRTDFIKDMHELKEIIDNRQQSGGKAGPIIISLHERLTRIFSKP